MQQFTTLLLRELRSGFRGLPAYFIIFTYLFAAIGAAFYFGSYLAMHDTALYAVFYAQPIILAVLVPVLTMRSWAEEYRSGTIEFLLTQPISFTVLTMAKFCAAVLFCLLMTLGLLPFICYSGGWLQLDWQNVASSYGGLLLLILFYCAAGCFISSLSRSLILAYLGGFFFTALWLVLPYSGLYSIYNNFLFAEVGISDILYFISLAAVFLFLNIIALPLHSNAQKHKTAKFSLLTILALCGAGFFNFAASNLFESKADLTASSFYTPKTQTVNLLNNLEKQVIIDVYAAKDYIQSNPDYFHYMQQVQRFLQRYSKAAKGMVTVNITYVEPFSELEEKVLEKGLYFETNAAGSRDYFGAIVRSQDGREAVIKQFLLQRQPLAEKDIDIAILKVTEPERLKNIGVYVDNMQNLEGLQEILLSWENDYNVFNVSPSMYDFSSKVDIIVLINPKAISAALRYALDQFLMRGGKVAVFFDFYTASQSDLTNGEDLQITDFLTNWGVKLLNPADDGKTDKSFGYNPMVLKLNKALLFEIDNPAVEVKPFIVNENGLIGAVMEGSFISLYTKNPFSGSELAAGMRPLLTRSTASGTVALVSDVDFLEEPFWVAENSPDRNPYSVIEKSGNGLAAKSLIDYLAGNADYEQLPLNSMILNKDSISQRLNKNIFSKDEVEYRVLQNKIKEQKRILFENSNEDMQIFEQLRQIGESGRELSKNEQQLQNLDYKMKQQYSYAVAKMMIMQIIAIPALLVLLLSVLAKFLMHRLIKRIKEKYNV